jgi:hypothetical protein
MRFYPFLFLGIFYFTLTNCGDTKMLREPFRIQYAKYDSRGNLPLELASSVQSCSPLLFKRFYNLLFVLPINKYSPAEVEKITGSSSIRYKTVLRPLDLFLTFFGFLLSGTVSTVEIESCSRPDSKTGKAKPNLKTFEEEFVEVPMLANYSNYKQNISKQGAKQFYISFVPKQNTIQSGDESKFEKFVSLFKNRYSKYKIFLLSHSDDADFKIASERLKIVKTELQKKGIDAGIIFSAIDLGTITSESDKKNKVTHRVDILILD